MKKITKIKIALDVVMMIVLALMYSKMAINLTFHEIGGLAVIGAFVIHKLLNFKWIAGVSKKLFSKNTPARTKALYIVDALMFVCFIIIGVSGVLISKKLFSFEMKGMVYKTLHYTTSAVALILIGVHLGLHATYLAGVFKKMIKNPSRALKPIAITLLVASVAFGAYSIASTSFVSWLKMPFSSGDMRRGEGEMPEGFDPSMIEGADMSGADEAQGEAIEALDGETEVASGDTAASEDGERAARYKGKRGAENASPFNALLVFAQYFSIAMVFATLTWAFEKFTRAARKR